MGSNHLSYLPKSIAPLTLGAFLWGLFLPIFGLVNLPWASALGLGGVIFERLAPPHPPYFDLFGVLIWPLCLLAAVAYAAQRIDGWPEQRRRIAFLVILASLIVNVSMKGILTTEIGQPFAYEDWPVYIRLWNY